jgi:hypothetical protein
VIFSRTTYVSLCGEAIFVRSQRGTYVTIFVCSLRISMIASVQRTFCTLFHTHEVFCDYIPFASTWTGACDILAIISGIATHTFSIVSTTFSLFASPKKNCSDLVQKRIRMLKNDLFDTIPPLLCRDFFRLIPGLNLVLFPYDKRIHMKRLTYLHDD